MALELDNIPGVTVDLQDGNLTIPRPLAGQSVILLGACVSGNSSFSEPLSIYQVTQPDTSARRVANYYGTSSETYSELSKAILECHAGGAQNIKYMNINVSGWADDTFTDSERYAALNQAYASVLARDDIDIVVPVGATIDASGLAADQNFGYQLANFCYIATASRNQLIGVLGVRPASPSASRAPTQTELQQWANALIAFTNCPMYDGTTANGDGTDVSPTGTYAFYAHSSNTVNRLINAQDPFIPSGPVDGSIVVDNDGTKVDIGMYINVCAMDVWAKNKAASKLAPSLGYYAANGAATYAGLITTLKAKSAPTKKILGGVSVQKPIALPVLNSLNGARFVCLENIIKGLTISNAMTGAHNVGTYGRSDFVRLSTVRIVFSAIEVVRLRAEPFIGEPNNPEARAALDTAIREGLQEQKREGALQGFSFQITSSPTDQVLGRANVNLVLTPAFELIRIPVTVALTFPEVAGA